MFIFIHTASEQQSLDSRALQSHSARGTFHGTTLNPYWTYLTPAIRPAAVEKHVVGGALKRNGHWMCTESLIEQLPRSSPLAMMSFLDIASHPRLNISFI
jgi:hypothetical protein